MQVIEDITSSSFWDRSNILIEPINFQKKYYPNLDLKVNGIDLKDPCPVYDENHILHMYGSVGRDTLGWHIFHAKQAQNGQWMELEPASLEGITGSSVAAPGMMYENGYFHMFIQTDCFVLGGRIEHLTSKDGAYFKRVDTPRNSIEESLEAGIYDPHPAIIHNKKYIVYSAMPVMGRPESINIMMSSKNSWHDPWRALGPILKQSEISRHHNQPYLDDYEWGVEGAQLIELPNKLILMNAVCFLPGLKRGTRQRVFFAIADDILGPYYSFGPVLNPQEGWEAGENGHAAAMIENDTFKLFYQARASDNLNDSWRYGLATCNIEKLQNYCTDFFRKHSHLAYYQT